MTLMWKYLMKMAWVFVDGIFHDLSELVTLYYRYAQVVDNDGVDNIECWNIFGDHWSTNTSAYEINQEKWIKQYHSKE